MASAKKVMLSDYETHIVLSKDETEFLRKILGFNLCCDRSNGKWSCIARDLYEELEKICPESNGSIKVREDKVLYIEN